MDLSFFVRRRHLAQALGLLLRLVLLCLAVPPIHQRWFLPFLNHVGRSGSPDPWSSFLASGGPSVAFPYGPLYLLTFGPLTWLFGLVSPRLAAFGLGATVLILDILLFAVLTRLVTPKHRVSVTYSYWLSPIVLYVLYLHGQLDVLPVLFLTLSLLLLRAARFPAAGGMLGLATAAKLSMGLAIPFVWIYVFTTRRLRRVSPRLIISTIAGCATLLPFAASPGFRRMVLGTPESEKIFALAIPYGDSLQFYVMPLAFAALIALAWRIHRFNFDVLFNLVGVGFFILFLLTPASPGWAMWLMPFIVMHLAHNGPLSWVLVGLFSGLFAVFHLTTSSGTLALHTGWPVDTPHFRNILLSTYLAAGGAIAYQMFQRGVVGHPYYRATRAPLLLGVAGDSGAGKDTLAAALRGLFGASSTVMVSGDDYHLWDRSKPMWSALTHLNPRANNLREFQNDILALVGYKAIRAPHYDHQLGRMTKPRVTRPADVVIASGLHALYTEELRARYDLSVYLSMDEDLRRFFKLRRDVLVRGHSLEAVLASLSRREADSDRYIRPQADKADLTLSLVPVDVRDIADPLRGQGGVRMRLAVSSRADLTPLVRAMVGIAGLQVIQGSDPSGRMQLVVEGDPSAADISAAARAIVPEMFDFLALHPAWSDGLTGVLQLVVLDQLARQIPIRRKTH